VRADWLGLIARGHKYFQLLVTSFILGKLDFTEIKDFKIKGVVSSQQWGEFMND